MELGLKGYRLHRKDLPGKPDIVWSRKKVALFVNGCFWHSHNCRIGRRTPKSNSGFWQEKFKKNRSRDAENIRKLRTAGWTVGVIWECELADLTVATKKLLRLAKTH